MAKESLSHPLLYPDYGDLEPEWNQPSLLGSDRGDEPNITQKSLRGQYRIVVTALILSCMLNLVQVAFLARSYVDLILPTSLPILYSPAQSVLRPAIRKFSPAFGLRGPTAIYVQPPSTAVDDAWKALYYTTLSISRVEAEPLANKTIPLSSTANAGYLTGLNVFHDLHCLDSIRKALWISDWTMTHPSDSSSTPPSSSSASHHPSPPHGDVDHEVLAAYRAEMHDAAHLMHCVNGLRESIMCHSDVTPLSWQWSSAEQDVRVYSDVAHTCRDFERVLEWGRRHATSEPLDRSGWKDERPPEVGRCGQEDEGCGWGR